MRKLRLFILGASCILMSGCMHISGGSAPSTKPLAAGSYRELGPARGEDCVYHLFGLIPLSNGNETKDAIADALTKQKGASALVNVSADTYTQYFILFSRHCTQVDGIAVAAN